MDYFGSLFVCFVDILIKYTIIASMHILFVLFPTILEKIVLSSMSTSATIRPRVDMVGMLEKISGKHFKRWQQQMKI